MKLARYIGNGRVEIRDEPEPTCPPGGLLVKTLACGLCSGELMDWYMDRKIPHVLGHEVCGRVVESQSERFPIGSKVFVHHHAACMRCEHCLRGDHVHCAQWKRTTIDPGGMAELFAVSAENLTDSRIVDDLRPIDGALIEPLACVMKSLMRAWSSQGILAGFRDKPKEVINQALDARVPESAVIGLGSMGLMHMLILSEQGNAGNVVGYDLLQQRAEYACSLGLDGRMASHTQPAGTVFVCPGSAAAINLGIEICRPGGTVLLFAPTGPEGGDGVEFNKAYFKDLRLANSYSCGPIETLCATEMIRDGKVKAEQVVSNFIEINDLPAAYQAMKAGDILKAMVVFE